MVVLKVTAAAAAAAVDSFYVLHFNLSYKTIKKIETKMARKLFNDYR